MSEYQENTNALRRFQIKEETYSVPVLSYIYEWFDIVNWPLLRMDSKWPVLVIT